MRTKTIKLIIDNSSRELIQLGKNTLGNKAKIASLLSTIV